MPWAAGQYTKGNDGTGGWVGDFNNGVGIQPTLHDNQDNDFTTGINSTLNKDGSNVPSGNLPMGGFRHTGVGLATARDSYATLGQAQDGTAIWGGTSGGTANAQTLTLSPAITAYVAGQRFGFIAGVTNTAATTLNVNGVGAINIITSSTGVSIASNYLTSGRPYEVLYNGTSFELLGDPVRIKTGELDYLGQSTGTANALVLTSTGPRIASTAIWKTFLFATNLTNTGATTVAIDGFTAINVLNPDTSALKAGELLGSRFYQLTLINGNALLANPDVSWQPWTPSLTQSVPVTFGITESNYKISNGNEVTCSLLLVTTSAGTASNYIEITGLPIASAWGSTRAVAGAATFFDDSSGIVYTLTVAIVGGTSIRFFGNSGLGGSGSFFGTTAVNQLDNNDVISTTFTYRI